MFSPLFLMALRHPALFRRLYSRSKMADARLLSHFLKLGVFSGRETQVLVNGRDELEHLGDLALSDHVDLHVDASTSVRGTPLRVFGDEDEDRQEVASSDTTIVKKPNGNASNLKGEPDMLRTIQTVNHRALNVRKGTVPVHFVTFAAARSARDCLARS
jgi:hypothetical protein